MATAYRNNVSCQKISSKWSKQSCVGSPTPPSPRLSIINEDETGARPFKGSVRYNYRLRFVEALPRTAENRVDFSLGSEARRVLIARCQPRRKTPPPKTPLANPCNPTPHWPQCSAKTHSPGPN